MKKFLVFFLFFFLFSVPAALAQETPTPNTDADVTKHPNVAEPITITNPLNVSTPQLLIGRVINSILGVVGSLALVMFVYGGLIWMTSSGSSDQVKKGKDILIWAAVGLVIIFSAYGIIRFVIQGVGA